MPVDFRKTEFIGVAADLGHCPPPVLPEVVLSGRSNVGKSSLINILADNRRLARISMTPGKTRLIIYFKIDNRLLLTDLPGYGYASASKQSKAVYSALADHYLTSSRPIALILHLMDIRHSPSLEDRQMLAWLDSHCMTFQIILTKADKLTRAQCQKRQQEMAEELGYEDSAGLLVFSAEDRQGVVLLRQRIAAVLQDVAL
jgi:GTP-binding protein